MIGDNKLKALTAHFFAITHFNTHFLLMDRSNIKNVNYTQLLLHESAINWQTPLIIFYILD